MFILYIFSSLIYTNNFIIYCFYLISLIQLYLRVCPLALFKMYSDIDCVFEGFGGKGRIYVSGMSAAKNHSLLSSLKIKSVISIAKSGLLVDKSEQIKNYLYIPAQDHENYDIKKHFAQTYEFIQKARKEANILVHCMAGISRSASVVIAYLMKKYEYSLSAVLPLLKRKRNKIHPNRGFMKQLEKYSSELGIKQVTHQGIKHKRVLSSLQFRKKEQQNISPENQVLKYGKKVYSPQKKSTKISLSDSASGETPKNIKSIDEKINILREKVMKVGKMRSKLNKSKNYEGAKFFSGQSLQMKPNVSSVEWKQSKSSQLPSSNQCK